MSILYYDGTLMQLLYSIIILSMYKHLKLDTVTWSSVYYHRANEWNKRVIPGILGIYKSGGRLISHNQSRRDFIRHKIQMTPSLTRNMISIRETFSESLMKIRRRYVTWRLNDVIFRLSAKIVLTYQKI